jgi:hypothetical protein
MVSAGHVSAVGHLGVRLPASGSCSSAGCLVLVTYQRISAVGQEKNLPVPSSVFQPGRDRSPLSMSASLGAKPQDGRHLWPKPRMRFGFTWGGGGRKLSGEVGPLHGFGAKHQVRVGACRSADRGRLRGSQVKPNRSQPPTKPKTQATPKATENPRQPRAPGRRSPAPIP